MPSKFDPANKEALVATSRLEHLDPQRVISLLPIRYYHTLADIGCGPGYFTIPLGKYVFDGKVYAIDVQQEMLDELKRRLEKINLTNVALVLSEENKIPPESVNESSLDGALMAFVLHEADNKKAFLKMALGLLQKGGWSAILEWYKREMDEGPPLKERLSEEETKKLAEAAGFRFVSQRDLNGQQYMVLLRK